MENTFFKTYRKIGCKKQVTTVALSLQYLQHKVIVIFFFSLYSKFVRKNITLKIFFFYNKTVSSSGDYPKKT